jgi:hypothetical protein
MFTKMTTATVLASTLLFTGASQAADISLESFVGSLVSQAVSVTQQEISNSVEKAVLTANNAIFMDESEMVATNVTITDLESSEDANQKDSDKAE